MIEHLHNILSQPMFGTNTDLAWSVIRALTMVSAGLLAWNSWRSSRSMQLVAVFAVALSLWLGLKIIDDIFGPGAQKLNVYFFGANLLWCGLLISWSQRINRERREAL